MKVVQAKLISNVRGKSVIELTCRVHHFFLARWLWGVPKYEIRSICYVGTGTVWRLLETYQRVDSSLEAVLADFEETFKDRAAKAEVLK